jgi:hypothetical protein
MMRREKVLGSISCQVRIYIYIYIYIYIALCPNFLTDVRLVKFLVASRFHLSPFLGKSRAPPGSAVVGSLTCQAHIRFAQLAATNLLFSLLMNYRDSVSYAQQQPIARLKWRCHCWSSHRCSVSQIQFRRRFRIRFRYCFSILCALVRLPQSLYSARAKFEWHR